MSLAKLYLACLPGWLNMRMTSPPSREDKQCFFFLTETFAFLATNFVARYKVSEVAKLGDIEGTWHTRQYQVPVAYV